MVDAQSILKKDQDMPAPGAEKQNQHDHLCEELLRERAAVLSRAGFAVEDALEKLLKLDHDIEEKIQGFRLLTRDTGREYHPPDRQSILNEINLSVDQFNMVRQKAEIQFYYLIVTREALGLRRHETVRRLYPIPPKKKKIQAI